jgi:uncharacterized membrane protein
MRTFLAAFLFPLTLVAQAKPSKEAVDFEKQIWPILEQSCVKCHTTTHTGPDGKLKKPKGGVTLDSKDGITGSKKGKLVVAKKPDDSLLYASVTLPADHEDRMPPQKEGGPLAKEKTDLIKKWIEEGAAFGKWTGKKAEAAGGKDKGKGKDADQDKPKGEAPADKKG